MEFWDVIERRHSIRDFKEEAVAKEVLERVLHAAALAPSAYNEQPWRYHVAEDEKRAEIGELMAQSTVHLSEYMDIMGPEHYDYVVQWYSYLGNAPVIVGVSAADSESEMDLNNKLLSVGASIENFLLAATAEGLATCNVTFAWWVREELGSVFEIGEDRSIVSIIALGHPSERPPAAPPHREDIADWLE